MTKPLSEDNLLADMLRNLPTPKIPAIDFPGNQLGEMLRNIPAPPMPSIDLPKFDIPNIELPKIDIPKFDVPGADFVRLNAAMFDVGRLDGPYLPAREFDMPRIPTIHTSAEANYASEFCDRLRRSITAFRESLDDELDVGICMVSSGPGQVLHLEDMGYSNPSIIIFIGHTSDGLPSRVYQHVSQINLQLITVPREDPEEPRRPIGFEVMQDGKE
jgi:hypothetical protein